MGNKLLKRDNVEGQIGENWTDLHQVSDCGGDGVVESLLKNGANIESVDKEGLAALCLASKNGNLGVIKQLLGKGAIANIPGVETT